MSPSRKAVQYGGAALASLLITKPGSRADEAALPPAPTFAAAALEHAALRRRWPKDGAGMVGIPQRSWPDRQPEAEEVPALREALAACVGRCAAERFTLATALIGTAATAAEGAAFDAVWHSKLKWLYAADAGGDADATCALAICKQNGMGAAVDEAEALELFRKAAAMDHAHARYELASMHYLGAAGLAEDEAAALKLWARAAGQGHAAAAFMLGDLQLEGLVLPRDAASALAWFVFAGDRGHRGARSRAFALTQPSTSDVETANGVYTDGSRLSLQRRATTANG